MQKTVAWYVFCVLFSAIILKMGSCLPSQLNDVPVDGASAVCSTCNFEGWAEICPQWLCYEHMHTQNKILATRILQRRFCCHVCAGWECFPCGATHGQSYSVPHAPLPCCANARYILLVHQHQPPHPRHWHWCHAPPHTRRHWQSHSRAVHLVCLLNGCTRTQAQTTCVRRRQRHRSPTCQSMPNTLQVDGLACITGHMPAPYKTHPYWWISASILVCLFVCSLDPRTCMLVCWDSFILWRQDHT